ncbi:MAG: hypothetical protein ACOH10_07920 [Rhodoglobus sp.]
MTRIISLDMTHTSHHYFNRDGSSKAQLMKVEAGYPCRVCGRGAGDAYLCRQCAESWEVHLGNIPSIVEDLEVAAQRRVRFGGRDGNPAAATGTYDPTNSESVQPRHLHTRHPHHTSNPMPVDLHSAAILAELQNELVGQARAMAETYNLDIPALGSDTARISRWLLTQADHIRRMEDADGLVRDLDRMMQRAVVAIDAPRRPKYVCQCTCTLAVWAPPGESVVACVCGAAYDVEDTRRKRILTAHDYLVSVREAHTLSGVSKNTIKSWIYRGELTIHGTRTDDDDGRTRAVVRFGDVVELNERQASA